MRATRPIAFLPMRCAGFRAGWACLRASSCRVWARLRSCYRWRKATEGETAMASVMNDNGIGSDADVRALVSDEEWAVRVDLAAAYRLVALYGWDDLTFTHLPPRVPGPEHHLLPPPSDIPFAANTPNHPTHVHT